MGMIGELYIGGEGVARGYLNRPELTAEHFIPNLFLMAEEATAHDNRLYKTGDLVRWLADGDMEYIGRNDLQVKIRGFRIELSEIENALSGFPGITQSVVLVKEQDENKYLIAYYVSDWEEEDSSIRSYLGEHLPQYMIPSIFIHLESLPLTVNGKVDRKALPDPTLSSKAIYVSPRDEVEEKLCVLWAEVLGLSKVGITDDFFKMGGSSILAIKLIHKMNKELNQSISITDLFAYKTIVNLKSILNNHAQKIRITKLDTEQAPLSYAQERLWFIERYEGGTNAYNVPMVLELNEKINIAAFKQSLNSLVNRHEILRTVFKQDAFDKDYQLVLNEPLVIKELSIENDKLNELIKKDVNHLFDLTTQYPIYIKIYKMEEKYYALVNIHHVAFDGWSVDIFLRELSAFYQHYHSGEALNLPEMDIQYKDFAKWQRDYLKGELLEKQVRYWKESLLGYEPLNLMTDKVRPSHIDYKGENVYFELDERLSSQLKKLAQMKGTTLYTVLLAGFYLFLNKYTGQEDLVIGTPLANRHYTQLENLIGFFINSLALRARVKNDQSIGELINHVHEVMLNAQKYQDVPFEKLVDALKIGQDSSRHPLFQIMFAVQSFGNLSSENDVFKLLPIGDNYRVAKFDLNIVIDDSYEKFKGVMNYAVSLYEKETIERFIKHYIYILKQIVENENYLLSELHILDENEYQQIVYEWNKSEKEYADNKTITTLFEEQVKKNPHSIALVFNDQTLSYQELNEQSNQLAWYIREQYKNFTGNEIKPDTLIAMCVERSFETIIGILAILKAGAAYVPMGATYPDDRIQFMLEDSGCKLVLTQSHLEEKISSIKEDILVIDLDKKQYKSSSISNLPTQNQPQDLAYVIYTSGTTGKPKGVMEPHNNVMRLLTATEEEYGFNEKDVWTLFHSYVFDFSVWEIWGALLKGSKLIIPSHEETRDTEEFYDSCEKHGVTILNQTPLAFYRFSETALNRKDKLESLRYIIFGGDILQLEKLVPWWNQYGSNQPKLINMYGITETTVHVTYKVLSESDLGFGSNIGRAIKDQKVYVLDEKMNVVPIGVFGEIYVGGAGLARGYLNRPELTAERFIPNPFATKEEIAKGHDRLYKSGDIARWHACGELEYIGRNDFQVKLRGFRIELGEIESVLAQFSEIQQSVVLVKERDGNKYLIGYYVADKKLDEEAIRFHLSEHLPEYMVPSILMHLNKLPLTINGKLDRKALPEYDFQLNEDHVAPRNDLEESLCKIWSDVLGVSEIGVKDDFFRVGGDSILSIQLVSRLRRKGYHCSIKSIFENRTVERLSHYIRSTVDVVTVDAEQGILTGEFNFLPIQQWFLDQHFVEKNHWNQSFLVKVPVLETQRLQNLLVKLAEQHDVLRMQYRQNTQVYLEKIIIPELKVLDRSGLTEAELQEILTSWQSGFNIENGPLWQLAYLHDYPDGSARIYFALHHLIVDSVSWRILIEDIKSLYHGEELGKKTSSYRQWVDTVKLYGKKHYQEAFYWQEVIKNQTQEYPHVDIEKHENIISLSKSLTQNLLKNTSDAYHTQINDLLLTALAYALKSWTGLDKNHITLEGHGRENIDERIDMSRTVGWFTSMYPVNLNLEASLADSIKAIKENLRKIPAKGLGYGALKYSCQHPGLVGHQLAPVSFNYLGQFDNEQGLWQVIGEASGLSIATDNQHELLVNINGWVMNGELQFSIVSQLKKNVAKCLSESFKYYLETIIAHCMEKINLGEIEHTASDFLSNENAEELIKENNADELFHFEEEIFNDY